MSDIILQEAQVYDTVIALTQGTTPLTWTLLSGPAELSVDRYTGHVTWGKARAGNHTVSVQIENQVGMTTISWKIQVNPGYIAFLYPISPTLYSQAQPITFSGRVQHTNDSEFLADSVQVNIEITDSSGSTRTLSTHTNSSGFFTETFHPAATEYGTYVARARHPDLQLGAISQAEWIVLGFKSTRRRVVLEGETVSEFERRFRNVTLLQNDGPGTLTEITATPLLSNTQDITIEVLLQGAATNVTLMPGDSTSLDIKVTAAGPLNRLLPIRLEGAEGTVLQIVVNLYIAQILPSFQITPSSVNTRVIRGRSKVIEFSVENVGSATATAVRSLLPATDLVSFVCFGSSHLHE